MWPILSSFIGLKFWRSVTLRQKNFIRSGPGVKWLALSLITWRVQVLKNTIGRNQSEKQFEPIFFFIFEHLVDLASCGKLNADDPYI